MKQTVSLGLLLALSWGIAMAQDTTIGARVGFSSRDIQGESLQYLGGELAQRWWQSNASGAVLASDVQLGLGALRGGGDTALMANVSLVVSVQPAVFPVAIAVGTGPTLLSGSRFGDADVGGTVQFTSHLGLNGQVGQWRLGYRYQHTSNAGLQSPNPGIDLHSFTLATAF